MTDFKGFKEARQQYAQGALSTVDPADEITTHYGCSLEAGLVLR